MITRTDFIQAVKNFRKRYRAKLKNLLNIEDYPETTRAFLTDPIIHAYLSRSSIKFADKHPDLHDSKSKDENNYSDHYELKVYQYLPNVILFRNRSITDNSFYTNGTPNIPDLFKALFETSTYDANDVTVHEPSDIYSIRSVVGYQRYKLKKTVPRFHIFPNWKDGHATTCISILDPITQHYLVTLFLDSKNDYYYTKVRFESTDNYSLKMDDPKDNSNKKEICKKYLYKIFSIDIDDILPSHPKTILVNNNVNAAFVINHTLEDRWTEEFAVVTDPVEVLYCNDIDAFTDKPVLKIQTVLKSPFLDASHLLQTNFDDNNCVLYSMNFIMAILELLKQPEKAEIIFKLAQTIKSDSSAETKLINIFQEDIKSYMPCYYDPSTRLKLPTTHISNHHLKQRWELGAKSLSIFYHPKEISNDGLSKTPVPK